MIVFGIWSPDEATFWQSWITAGICSAPYVFNADYQEVQVTAGSWGGQIEGVDGWHCNARVWGALEAEMTYGLDQYDAQGNLKDVFDRTWAPQIFQLTEQEADETTGFPAGYRNNSGVTYCDYSHFSSPSNVWQ